MQERIIQSEGVEKALSAYGAREAPVQVLLREHACSQHALYKALRKQQIPLRSEQDGRPRCEFCGDPFTPHHQKPDQKICSRDCYHEIKRAKARLDGSIIECRCGFEVHHKKAIDALFCSERCKAEALAEEMRTVAKRVARYVGAGVTFAEAVRVIGTTEYFAKRACKNYCGVCGTKFTKGDGQKWCLPCSGRRG